MKLSEIIKINKSILQGDIKAGEDWELELEKKRDKEPQLNTEEEE